MFKKFINLFKPRPLQPTSQTQVLATPRQHQEPINPQTPDIRNMPPSYNPIDSVCDTTQIPETILEIGSISRVVETNQDERIEFNQQIGIKAGCSHMIFSINQVGGFCGICFIEASQLFNQGLISQHQAESHSIYCTDCASYCMLCFKRICTRHTRLHQTPDCRIIPLCPVCYEASIHKSLIKKIITILNKKIL